MRLVAAIDVADGAEAVIHQAIPWARRLHGTLDLAFASEWSTEGLAAPPFPTPELDALWTDWKQRASEQRAALARLVAELPADVRGADLFLAGRPVDVLPDAVQGHDLLVVATHARRGLERVLLGSVTARLVRHLRTPTLVVGLGDPVHDPSGRLLVLAPLDDSEDGALPWIRDHLGGEHVEIVHVLPPDWWIPPALLNGGKFSLAPGAPSLTDQRRAASDADLRARARQFGFPAANVHLPCRDTANPGDAVARVAHDANADVIVMPTQGLQGVERWFLGSVAERVVERAPCPVLVVPKLTSGG